MFTLCWSHSYFESSPTSSWPQGFPVLRAPEVDSRRPSWLWCLSNLAVSLLVKVRPQRKALGKACSALVTMPALVYCVPIPTHPGGCTDMMGPQGQKASGSFHLAFTSPFENLLYFGDPLCLKWDWRQRKTRRFLKLILLKGHFMLQTQGLSLWGVYWVGWEISTRH